MEATTESPAVSTPGTAGNFVDVLRWRAIHQAAAPAITFLEDGESSLRRVDFAALDRGARAVAATLQSAGAGGKTALLALPSGLDYVSAFLGCLYSGVIAVPAYPPRWNKLDARLAAMAADAGASHVLTSRSVIDDPAGSIDEFPGLEGGDLMAVDEIDPARADDWDSIRPAPDAIAFLQYTSGSTATPRGVMVAHDNLLHNQRLLQRATGNTGSSTHVSWLPLHHDLGLVASLLQSLYLGAHLILMPTESFVRRPLRWLQAITRYRGATSLAPNFAFDLCVRKIPPEDRVELDLASWALALNGAEPVRPATLDRFRAAFEPHGLHPGALYPAFGLAEATGFVSGGRRGAEAKSVSVDSHHLEGGRVIPIRDGPGARRVVSCGRSWLDQEIVIVDPETRVRSPSDRVGEIWVTGPSIARGYWNRPLDSRQTFQASLAGESPVTYLRTGDLGFMLNGDLFFTSRLKDLIIIDGLNHSPQDIEQTAERAHPSLRPGFCAAFAIELEDLERLVVVAEIKPDRNKRSTSDPARRRGDPEENQFDEAGLALIRAIAEEHGLRAHEVMLLPAGSISRTSSGKIQRHACKRAYLSSALDAVWRG